MFILLNKHKDLFDGSIEAFDVPPIQLEVREGTDPVHSRYFPVHHMHKEILYKEIQRMIALSIL